MPSAVARSGIATDNGGDEPRCLPDSALTPSNSFVGDRFQPDRTAPADSAILVGPDEQDADTQSGSDSQTTPVDQLDERLTAAERARLEEMAAVGSAVSTWVLRRLLRQAD